MRTKKSLGQHFLTSEKIAGDIVAAASLTPSDTVLEIGPGKGMLTNILLESAGQVIAVEKDENLIATLKKKFEKNSINNTLQLIVGDILSLPIKNIVPSKYVVVANIPYYITGNILRKLLSGDHQPERMVLLLQKEVAERIVATDKKESLLSISVKVYGTPKYVKTISKQYFKPIPSVDSAIIAIENISRNFFKEIEEGRFFELLKAGFAFKRKLLIRNLERVALRNHLEDTFQHLGIPKNTRAEDLPKDMWYSLAQVLP